MQSEYSPGRVINPFFQELNWTQPQYSQVTAECKNPPIHFFSSCSFEPINSLTVSQPWHWSIPAPCLHKDSVWLKTAWMWVNNLFGLFMLEDRSLDLNNFPSNVQVHSYCFGSIFFLTDWTICMNFSRQPSIKQKVRERSYSIRPYYFILFNIISFYHFSFCVFFSQAKIINLILHLKI